MRARLVTFGALLGAALLGPAKAHGDERPIAIDVTECEGLNGGEVERVLTLELAEVTRHATRTLRVKMSCPAPTTVRIAVDDPVTGKELSREVPAPKPSEPGRERALGLAASQLFLASWLELLSPDVPPPTPRQDRAPATDAARSFARRTVLPSQPGRRLELLAVAAMTTRDPARIADDGLGFALGLAARIWIAPRLALTLDPVFESAAFIRNRGSVRANAGMLGAGVAVRLFPGRTFDVGAELTVAGGYGWVTATARDGSVAGTIDGPTTDVSLGAGPTLRTHRLVVSLRFVGGITALAPVGKVIGEDDATLAGAHLGLALELGANAGDEQR